MPRTKLYLHTIPAWAEKWEFRPLDLVRASKSDLGVETAYKVVGGERVSMNTLDKIAESIRIITGVNVTSDDLRIEEEQIENVIQ